MHEAGADCVLSFASMGANAVLHYFLRGDTLMIAEGLDVFRVKVPKLLSDKTIAETHIRRDTGCTVIALCVNGYDAGKPGLSIAYADGDGNAAHR